jgi:hypothetical protein
MENKILKRILNRLSVPDLDDRIVDRLSFSEMQSLLIEIFDRKTKNLMPSDIYRQYLTDAYVGPSGVGFGEFLRFDSIAVPLLPDDCAALELSPVSPLGCCSRVGNISQKRILSTIRKNEVSSDPTNVLALAASRLRRENLAKETVKLAASQRIIRSERTVTKDSFPHFRIFCLCIAGADRGSFEFETASTLEVVRYYGRLLAALRADGHEFASPEIVIHCRHEGIFDRFRSLEDPGLNPAGIPVSVKIDPEENWSYYSNLRFRLFIACGGERQFIADGGDVDWTQKIIGSKKERFLISGFGSERFIAVARRII